MQEPIKDSIISKIQNHFQPAQMEVVNESHMHSVPKNSETHFKVFVVSESFEGTSRVQRQREIYQLLDAELKGPVHALTMRLLTPEEWEKQGQPNSPQSPDCHGGSKV